MVDVPYYPWLQKVIGPLFGGLRQIAGITKAQVVRRAGVSLYRVTRFEAGLAPFTRDQLYHFLLASGVNFHFNVQFDDPELEKFPTFYLKREPGKWRHINLAFSLVNQDHYEEEKRCGKK